MKLIKPNSTTWFALAHPVLWSVLTALFVGLLGLYVFEDWRAGLMGGVFMLALNAFLWRPHGPFRRWAERQRDLRGSA